MGHINKKLILLKLLLFFLYAAIGCLIPFLTNHMYHIGLSHEEVTWINTVLPLTAIVGPPFVGYLADTFGNYRAIILISMGLAGIFHTALLYVPERQLTHKPNLQMVCGSEGSTLVLQSCTGECPSINKYIHSDFRISDCRQECNIQSRTCAYLTPFALGGSNQSRGDVVDAEISLDSKGAPNICLHEQNSVNCNNFALNSFIDVKRDFDTSSEMGVYYNLFEECCEYPFSEFGTENGQFSNMTCNTMSGCHVVCNVQEMSNSSYVLQSPKCSSGDGDPRVTFWLYFVLRAIADLFPAILISLFDAVVLTMVAQYGGDYGRQKMFGLFAIGTSAPLVGYLVDVKFGIFEKYIYGPVFYVFDALLLLSAIVTFFLPLKVEVKRTSMLKNLTQLVRTLELDVLFLVVTTLGLLYGFLETFLYIHLKNDLSASNLLLGLTITVGIVPSVPFLYKSDIIVNYCGHHYLLILAFVGYCIRFAGLSYLTNPLWVIPIEILELLTINLMQVTAATLAYKLAPKTLVATAQGLIWLAHFDVGRALGTIIGGYFIKSFGVKTVFQIASVFSAVCAVIYLTGYQLIKYMNANRARPALPEPKENGAVKNGSYMPLPMADQKC